MKQKCRTEYSVRNTTVAFAAQTAAILMGFFTRVVFTHTLSEGYVGINGLFTDILNILSLSELGVGTAITYALYTPIARGDIQKQQIRDADVPHLLPDHSRFCADGRSVPDPVSGCPDEGSPGCGSSDLDLSAVSAEFGRVLFADLQENTD